MSAVTQKLLTVHHDWLDELVVFHNKVIRTSNNEIADIIETDLNTRRYKIFWHKRKVYEYLQYNEISNNFWCFGCDNVEAKQEETPFIILCKKKSFINFSAALNCQTSILKNAARLDGNIKPHESHFENNKISYETYNSQHDKYKKHKKFIVYSDPVERFTNVINYIYTNQDDLIGWPFLNRALEKNAFIEELIKISQIYNNNKDITKGDPNLLSQTKIFSQVNFDEVEVIVRAQDMKNFARNVLKITDYQTESFCEENTISAADLSLEQIERIKNIYKNDYEIFKKYNEKVYYPCDNEVVEENKDNSNFLLKSLGFGLITAVTFFLPALIYTRSARQSLYFAIFEMILITLIYFAYEKLTEND